MTHPSGNELIKRTATAASKDSYEASNHNLGLISGLPASLAQRKSLPQTARYPKILTLYRSDHAPA
jgi:hypothetical protein